MVLAGPHSSQDDIVPLRRKNAVDETLTAEEMGEQRLSWIEYTKIILPHVGLAILCVLYTIAGATVFYVIERPNETLTRSKGLDAIHRTRVALLDNLWRLSSNLSHMTRESWESAASVELDKMTKVLFMTFNERYITLDNIQYNSSDDVWSFPSAIFFAASTITTIGYGNLVPGTEYGRILCVFFGLFGIPLMLVTIADIGKFIGDGILLSFAKYERMKLAIRRRLGHSTSPPRLQALSDEGRSVPVSLVLVIIIGYTSLGGLLFQWLEDWTFFQSFYFSFITMSTIGFGDYAPVREKYYVFTILYIMLGLAITTMCIDLVGSQYIQKIHFFGRKIQSAKNALRTVGDLVRYTAFLRRKYGMSDAELQQVALGTDLADFLGLPDSFIPPDIARIYFIDQTTISGQKSYIHSENSFRMASVATGPPPIPRSPGNLRKLLMDGSIPSVDNSITSLYPL